MDTRDVYITAAAGFLPNNPVGNEDMEKVLGSAPSRTRKIVLRNNGIKTRYYAIDPETGATTHTCARMAAEAVRRLSPRPGFSVDEIQLLACATTAPDQLMPGHASMVHGELATPPCEVMSAAGICLSSMAALKYAIMSIKGGEHENAVACGSEQSSSFMRARFCGQADDNRADELEKQPGLAFEADFLRWMLSDGAGAVFLQPEPAESGVSLKIDWLEMVSHSGDMPVCMYAGGRLNDNGEMRGWREYDSLRQAADDGAFLVRQDARLLNHEVLNVLVNRSLPQIVKKRGISPEQIDWFLPHYSSEYFRKPLAEHLKTAGFAIPEGRWFTNLVSRGNTGSAAIYLIIDELFNSGRLKKGDRIFCFIPESGRFSVGYLHMTAV